MYDITIHRDINNNIINFESEQMLTVFYAIVKKYNDQETLERIKMSKIDLWELTGFNKKDYSGTEFNKLITKITHSNTFSIAENIKLSGSIFVTEQRDDDIYIEIPRTYLNYIYNSKDLSIISKNKYKEPMNTEEVEYFNEEIVNKNKTRENILLLKQADILNIQGKYNKRLYTLLMMRKTKEHKGILIENYIRFKKLLEIPEAYKQGHIDVRMLKLPNKELEKAGICITEIKKIKEKNSIKTIEIYFEYNGDKNKIKKEADQKETKVLDPIEQQNISFTVPVLPEEIKKIGTDNISKIRQQLKTKT